jgi:hypothetical protein
MGRSVLRPYMFSGVAKGHETDCARDCCELGGEAVGGDRSELPGGELVEIFFVGV